MAMQSKPKLLDHMRMAIRALHDSIRTEQAYVAWARRFIIFHNKRHPKNLGAAQVDAFLTYLATTRKVLASTQNQAKSALLFLINAS
jgi:Phage integrase, N-terminal SAM-like domain